MHMITQLFQKNVLIDYKTFFEISSFFFFFFFFLLSSTAKYPVWYLVRMMS